MTGPGGVVALTLVWAVVAYRTQALMRADRRPETWAVWAAIVALAMAATLFQPDVYHAVYTATGIGNLAELLGHMMILVAAWQGQALMLFLIHPVPAARRKVAIRGGLVAVTVAVMAVFFTLAPVDLDVPLQFTTVYADAPWIVSYWVTFLFTVDLILVDMVRLVLRYAKRTSREHLRFGLQLVAIGGVLGVGYWCQWLAYLVLRHTGATEPSALHALGTVCALGALIFTVVGSIYPALGARVGLRTPTGWWTDVRRYRQLRPLWQALTAATPQIVLSRPPRVVIDARFWLRRRVIEIEDGLLQLGELHGPADGVDADPVAAARAIQQALRTRTARTAPVLPAGAATDDDYTARLAWQLDVARAFARLPRHEPAGHVSG